MNLKKFVATKEVRDWFAPFRAALARPHRPVIRVPPGSSRRSLIGTAFDYLLRFELKRRAPHAVEGEWVAVTACSYLEMLLGPSVSEDQMRRVVRAVDDARETVARHRQRAVVSECQVADLAGHALRLAAIDPVRRAGVLDPAFDRVDPDDVADLLALWAVVPWADLVRDGPVLLNPVFGHGSPRVGGADADLIAGSALIDVKVVKENVQAADLNQLFGYWLLAREQRRCDQAFPAITHVGVYLARHGLCWTAPVDPILNAPGFGAVEEWFRAHAARVYPRREAVPLPPDWPDDLRPPLGSADPEAWARFAAAEARPHLGPRWGWPGPEMIRAIPEALARLAATGDVARMRLCPESLRFERGLAGGPPVVTLSIGRPLAPGSVLAPGQFDRLGWVKPSARPGQLPDRPERSATPADFPGLIDHYPQAAWDFFLRLAKPAPAGDNGGRR